MFGTWFEEILFELVFYYTGRLAIVLISLGRWRCEPWLAGGTQSLRHNFSHRRNNRFYITSYASTVFGGIICLSLIGISIWEMFWHLNH